VRPEFNKLATLFAGGVMKRSIHLLGSAGAALLTVVFGLAGAARADVTAWDEAVNGPLSSSGDTPTPLAFIAGVGNDVLGVDGRAVAGGPVDRDYFTFTVPTGSALTALIVLPGTTSASPPTGGTNVSFIGIEAGPKITLPTNATTADGLLGWRHFAGVPNPEPDIGKDILAEIGNPNTTPPLGAPGATGFTPPLGPGTYSVWIQETGVCGPDLCHYGFDFVLAVPEPASAGIVLTALAFLTVLRRHRRRSLAEPQ
jgi:hypothetical protein